MTRWDLSAHSRFFASSCRRCCENVSGDFQPALARTHLPATGSYQGELMGTCDLSYLYFHHPPLQLRVFPEQKTRCLLACFTASVATSSSLVYPSVSLPATKSIFLFFFLIISLYFRIRFYVLCSSAALSSPAARWSSLVSPRWAKSGFFL